MPLPLASLVNFDVHAQIESFIRLNPNFSRNTQIENLWMIFPNSVKLIPYLEDLFKKENKIWSNNEADFLREDLVEPVMRILYPEGEYKIIIDKLRPFIPAKDTASLLFAADICYKENNKVSFDDSLARKKLSEANRNRGLTLYNWLRSEEVFPFDILPYIESKDSYQDQSLFCTMFSCFWDGLIQAHPSRIFIAVGMRKEDIRNEIIRRAVFKKSKKITIYSRCTRNNMVDKMLKNFKVSYSLGNKIKWKFKRNTYKIGYNDAMRVEIFPIISKG